MPRMTGNHISIGGNGGQYFFIDWQLAGQDVTNNYSAINWQAYFHYNMADAQLDSGIAGLSGTRWDNGGRVKNFEGRFVTRDVILASGSFNIGHNADGTQGLSVSGGVSAYQSGRSAGSQWFSLPTIPRNSQVTSTGSTSLGSPVQINTNRKSSSFTHTITIRMHNSGGTVLQTINSVGDSTTWTPSPAQITQMQNAIPNTNSLTLWIWSHNNQVGQGSATTTRLDITDANPIFSNFTYKDSNASVTTITGNDQVLVKGKSTLEVTVPSADKMVAQKGATADYYAIAYDGVSNNEDYSASNVTSDFTNIDTVGSRAILVTAYDSRTNNTRVAKNVQVYDYVAPNIEFEVTRENNFGEDVTIETGGTFDLLPINGVNKNSLTASSLKYRYKEKGAATWGAYATIPFTVTDDGFAGTNQFISLDNTKAFEFEFQVADKFGTHTQATELGAGTPIMFAGRYSNGNSAVGINKVPENGVLDVDGDIYSNGEKVVTGEPGFKVTQFAVKNSSGPGWYRVGIFTDLGNTTTARNIRAVFNTNLGKLDGRRYQEVVFSRGNNSDGNTEYAGVIKNFNTTNLFSIRMTGVGVAVYVNIPQYTQCSITFSEVNSMPVTGFTNTVVAETPVGTELAWL